MTDKNDPPFCWDFPCGRHNEAFREEGKNDLWYVWETKGSGRTRDGWAFYVLPDSCRCINYHGKNRNVVISFLKRNALFWLEGRGGRDYGKGFMSKGGYRAGRSIPYFVEHSSVASSECLANFYNQEYDQLELDKDAGTDDELLQSLSITPTCDGVAEWMSIIESFNEDFEQKKNELEKRRLARREAERIRDEKRRKIYDENKSAVEARFADITPPPKNFFIRFTDEHCVVTEKNYFYSKRGQFSAVDEYEAWRLAVVAEQEKRELSQKVYLEELAHKKAKREKAINETALRRTQHVRNLNKLKV